MQKRILSIVLLLSILSLTAAQSLHTRKLDNNGLAIPSESKLQIASWYAPVLWFYKDPVWEEPFTLVEADYFIKISQKDNFGNYKLSHDGYAGAKTLQSQYDGIQNPVYVRVTTDEYDREEYIVIQYWFCYLYNYGGALSVFNINHEGEWEMIEVILSYSESILNGTSYPEPYIVAYSRHAGGEAHRWENEWIEKKEVNGYHPVAYVAYGTHAPYFQDLGWNEDLNKGFDVSYADMNFILIEDKEWLNFSGRWGGQENSPFGPMFQEIKWDSPVLWGMEYLDTYQFHLERPGHLLITNGEGNRIGFVGGEFVNEIHNSYAIITETHEYYSVPEDDYSVEITSSEEGDVEFDVIINDNGEATLITYEHELAKHITKIYTEISSDLKEHVLKMDEDGDGKIDLTLKPDETIHYLNEKEYSLLLLAAAVVLVVVAAFALYRILRKRVSKDRKRTKKEWLKSVLERIAAAFFLLWIIAAVTDLLVEYEVEFLQCAVGIYLISQILSVFEPEYTPGKKIQKFFTSLGWPLIGFWAVFTLLEWSRWVGPVEIGIDIDYFLVIGVIFLVLGYTIAFFRSAARFGIVRFLLFVIGGFSFSFWIFTRIFSIFSEYADYILVVGIVSIGLGLVLGLKRPGKTKESPREEEEALPEEKVEN